MIEGNAPPVTPPRPTNYVKQKAPPYSDRAILSDAWTKAWMLLEADEAGNVTRVKFLKRPGYDLEKIAVSEAFKLTVDPALDGAKRPMRSNVVWEIEIAQHQIASGVHDGTEPYYFVELNQNSGGLSDVAVVSYDTVNGYVFRDSVPHSGIHPGIGILRYEVSTAVPKFSVVAGWVGELYSASAAAPGFTGGSEITIVFNGLDLLLRYVVVIDATP